MNILEQRIAKLEHALWDAAFILSQIPDASYETHQEISRLGETVRSEITPIENAAQLHGLLTGPTKNVVMVDATGSIHELDDVVGDNDAVIGAFIGMDYPIPKMVSAWLPPNYDMAALAERAETYSP